MFLFITALIFGIIGLALVVIRNIKWQSGYSSSEVSFPVWMVGVGILAFASLLFFFSTYRSVPPRSVGIKVSLGKVQGTLQSGPHLVKPWVKVISFPSTIETTRLQGDGKADIDDGPCVTVRLGNQTTACVNATIQWHVNVNDSKGVDALYASYRSFNHIEPNLVRPQVQHSLLAPFENYNPLAVLAANGNLETPTKTLEDQGRTTLEQVLGNGISVTQYTINLVQYDAQTQDKINGYSSAVADTRIATQQEQTANARRAANDALNASQASTNPGVITQNCLDLTERLSKDGKSLPASWTCLGNGATPVVNVK